jgi:5-methylcytosine-specific restriction endonuclease McrA
MSARKKKGGRIKGQGFRWIRLSTRLAIYERDGFECAYCRRPAFGSDDFGPPVYFGKGLSLDHLIPIELGGDNDPENLITSCISCNSAKSAKTLRGFLSYLRAEYGPRSTDGVATRIRRLKRKPLDREAGRRLAGLRENYSPPAEASAG